jgi:hypothetical protein
VFYQDLTPYEYLGRVEPDVYNIGWLDVDQPFPTGAVPEQVIAKIFRLCATPANRTRDWHTCPFCPATPPIEIQLEGRTLQLGDAEIRVPGRDGKVYAAPTLV